MEDDQDWIDFFEALGVTLKRALIVSYVVVLLVGFVMGKMI